MRSSSDAAIELNPSVSGVRSGSPRGQPGLEVAVGDPGSGVGDRSERSEDAAGGVAAHPGGDYRDENGTDDQGVAEQRKGPFELVEGEHLEVVGVDSCEGGADDELEAPVARSAKGSTGVPDRDEVSEGAGDVVPARPDRAGVPLVLKADDDVRAGITPDGGQQRRDVDVGGPQGAAGQATVGEDLSFGAVLALFEEVRAGHEVGARCQRRRREQADEAQRDRGAGPQPQRPAHCRHESIRNPERGSPARLEVTPR